LNFYNYVLIFISRNKSDTQFVTLKNGKSHFIPH
jgi:hypothetical protein